MLLANSSTTEVERDGLLWKEMKEGNEFAFREIFDIYSDLLFQYGTTIGSDRELIKDSVQELFITLWTHRNTIGNARSVKYYLFFSLRRIILKKLARSKNIFSLSASRGAALLVESQDQVIFRREININNQQLVNCALEALPTRQKEIIFLKFYQELSNEEIEKIMNLNNQVVRNTLYKALSSLRKKIGNNRISTQLLLLISMLTDYTARV